jgi:hypothetical protein
VETVLKAIGDWLKSLLTAGIMSNLSGLFDAVNEQVGDIAQQVGTRPSALKKFIRICSGTPSSAFCCPIPISAWRQ